VGVANSIFICFVYYVLQEFGFGLGTAGVVPPLVGAWFPNAFFGCLGLVLTLRAR
jgi:lipopolysaccharide export LptBFGC system permease protein LptF